MTSWKGTVVGGRCGCRRPTWSADGAHLNVAEALVLICDAIDRFPEYRDREIARSYSPFCA
jgi:hypothetical protein